MKLSTGISPTSSAPSAASIGGLGYTYTWAWNIADNYFSAGSYGATPWYDSAQSDIPTKDVTTGGWIINRKADSTGTVFWGLLFTNGGDLTFAAVTDLDTGGGEGSGPATVMLGGELGGSATPDNKFVTYVMTLHPTKDLPSLNHVMIEGRQEGAGFFTTFGLAPAEPPSHINGVQVSTGVPDTTSPGTIIPGLGRDSKTGFKTDGSEKGKLLSVAWDLGRDPDFDTNAALDIERIRWQPDDGSITTYGNDIEVIWHGVIFGPEPAYVKSLPIEVDGPIPR